MKIQVLSDLHLEWFSNPVETRKFLDSLLPEDPADVVVIAGDLCTRAQFQWVFEYLSHWNSEIIYIPGNHDFYGSSFFEVQRILFDLHYPNIHVLDNDIVEIDEQRFVRSTLWFPDSRRVPMFIQRLNDFHVIEDFERNVKLENKLVVDFLWGEVQENDIVISHFLPLHQSVAKRFQGSEMNCLFLCDCSNLIENRNPKIWIHGHTYESFRYDYDITKVICNPFGYFGYEENRNFEKNLVVDTEE